VRVLFWKGPCGFFGTLVRIRTRSAYIHSELLFSDGARFRIAPGEVSRFYVPADAPRWDGAVWDCLEVAGGDEAFVRKWCFEQSGTKYDWLGLALCQVLPWGREHPDRWFCSEQCTAGLQAGGYPAVADLKPHYQSPAKLAAALVHRGATFQLP